MNCNACLAACPDGQTGETGLWKNEVFKKKAFSGKNIFDLVPHGSVVYPEFTWRQKGLLMG